jgi:DNA-binding response OmpR family regulator
MAKAKRKISIIEDDVMISQMYSMKLVAAGFEVITYGNGMEGLEGVKENVPDLLLLDIMLPQTDGFSILRKLKEDPKTDKVPVIILTNLGTEEDQTKGKEFGAVDYIVKASFTPAEVLEKIEKYLV